MIARVGFFEDFDFEDREYVVETVSAMPGFLGIYHLTAPDGGDALSVSFWSDAQHAEAAQEAVGRASRAGNHEGPGPSRVATYDVVHHLPQPQPASPQLAEAIASAWADWMETGVMSAVKLFAPDFHDHVSERRGHEVFEMVGSLFTASFADRRAEVHSAMADGDRVMVWSTLHGTHVGNALPRLAGLPISGRTVHWSQLHAFRVEDEMAVEHWAVRDDYGLVEQLSNA